MFTLGINAVYHDSAACLIENGRLIAAAEEERFTRIKHAKRPVPFATYELPFHAIDYCLRVAGIKLSDVDHVAYSYDPYQLLGQATGKTIRLPLEPSSNPPAAGYDSPWDPLFLSYVVNAPRHLAGGAPHHLRQRLGDGRADYRWHFVDHHLAHEASAFLPSPFEQAAVMTLDGRGERATTTCALGEGQRIERLNQVDMPHSLGLLYEEVTRYLGFQHASDEYKVMALAAYGKGQYRTDFQTLITLDGQGRFSVDPPQLEARFGKRREPGEPLNRRHFDIARSLQEVVEETVLALCDWLYRATKTRYLTMAGGVALNCIMNGRLRREGPFRDIWVQPAAGDAGTALGAALWVDAQMRGKPGRRFVMDHTFYGPSYSDAEVETLLRASGLPFRRLGNVADYAAQLLASDKVIGWFQGAMEFGPRALGGRSVLASPLKADARQRLNEIKDREDFRPVAPVVLEEEAPRWFQGCRQSPFMTFAYPVVPDKAKLIPAAVHVDGTARVQTVNRVRNSVYYDLVKAFQAHTGVPVLINTSFNTQGEPIVCSPRDALACFWTSPLDALVIGPYVLEKTGLAHGSERVGRRADLQTPASA